MFPATHCINHGLYIQEYCVLSCIYLKKQDCDERSWQTELTTSSEGLELLDGQSCSLKKICIEVIKAMSCHSPIFPQSHTETWSAAVLFLFFFPFGEEPCKTVKCRILLQAFWSLKIAPRSHEFMHQMAKWGFPAVCRFSFPFSCCFSFRWCFVWTPSAYPEAKESSNALHTFLPPWELYPCSARGHITPESWWR